MIVEISGEAGRENQGSRCNVEAHPLTEKVVGGMNITWPVDGRWPGISAVFADIYR
jgi:hypothetical protein